MSINRPLFSSIPDRIARQARALYSRKNIYLIIGNQLDNLFTALPGKSVIANADNSYETKNLFFLISAIQYEEELPDIQFIASLPARVDIKYALHLSDEHLNFDAVWISGYRRQISGIPIELDRFQALLNRLKEIGYLCQSPEKSRDASIVLRTISIASLIERVIEAMYELLEKLAIQDADWLRGIILPQWYKRYNRARSIPLWPDLKNNWRELPKAIGHDLSYLLDKIDKSPVNIQDGLPSVLVLKQAWEDLYQAIEN